MTAFSTAIGLERRSRVSGYKINKGNFDNDTPNLPQIIAIFGEANTANQGTLNTAKREVTSAEEAGRIYGYGSPIHQIVRILRPISGDGVGGIPTIVFPQVSDEEATETTIVWTVSGTATANATHEVIIGGRAVLDYIPYSYSVVIGDTAAVVAGKIATAINAVLGSPVSATVVGAVLTLKTKWKGASSATLKTSFSNNGTPAAITYALTSTTAGAGTVALAGALSQFGNDWYTHVINPYGTSVLGQLEQFNGVPDPVSPTGRYEGTIFKPFCAYFGSTLTSKDDLAAITNDAARINQVTNVLCPAPKSDAFPWEAAANMVRISARLFQDAPHRDINGTSYPDMPVPLDGVIGDMSIYNNRDFLVKKGCSTVILNKGAYVIEDVVTTYHPEGESPLQYAYPRNLNIDWNFSFGYRVLETLFVKDKTLVRDNQIVGVEGVIKPKDWKAILCNYADDMAERAMINEPDFTKASIRVQISTDNPDRFETTLRYKRTGVARIESTDVEAGF